MQYSLKAFLNKNFFVKGCKNYSIDIYSPMLTTVAVAHCNIYLVSIPYRYRSFYYCEKS